MFVFGIRRLLSVLAFISLVVQICSTQNPHKITVDMSNIIRMHTGSENSLEELKTIFETYQNSSLQEPQSTFNIKYSINSDSNGDINELKALGGFLSNVLTKNLSIDLFLSVPYENGEIIGNRLGNIVNPINGTAEQVFTMAEVNLKIGIRYGGTCNEDFGKGLNSLITTIKSWKISHSFSFVVSKLEIGVELEHGELENCQNLFNSIDFLINTVKLETFVESYGLFERTLANVNENTLKLLKVAPTLKQFVFYQIEIGQFFSFCQLRQFSENWIAKANMKHISGIIIPLRFENLKNPEIDCLSKIPPAIVIPSILEYDGITDDENIKWYQPDVLKALNEKFTAVLLNYDQWDDFTQEISKSPGNPGDDLIDLIIDFSHGASNPLNWTEIEKKLLGSKTNVKLTSLAFPITGNKQFSMEFEDLLLRIENREEFQVGCVIQPPIELRTNTDSEFKNAITNCLNINGNFSIFTITFDLAEASHYEFSYSYYINRIQPFLVKTLQIRSELRTLYSKPDFKIFLHIETKSSPKLQEKYTSTVFCNAEVLKQNEYFEGILNFARRNHFPIILKSAFDSIEKPDVSTWLSVLRPITSIYSFSNGFPQLRSSHPIFVIRNHPQNINGWSTSPCIPWLALNPEENSDFLSNTHAGSILRLGLKQDNSISVPEIQTMFQFLVHKFSIVEILLHNAPHVYALGDAFSPEYVQTLLRNNISHRPKFFMDYNIEDGDIRPDRLPSIYLQFREFQRNTLISAEGVHVHYSEILKSEREGRSYSVAKMLSSSSTVAKLKVGLVMPGICMDELQLAQRNRTSALRKAMKKMHYIVCKEVIHVETTDGIEDMGTLLDTHLYIKRSVERDYPGLGVYFKLELDIELSKNKKNMARYKRFLKHCQLFGAAYDIQYFMVEVFDSENSNGRRSNGWWAISEYSDLTNVDVYTEKEAAYSGRDTWRPPKSGYRNSAANSSNYEMSGTVIIALLFGLTVLFLLLLIGSICLVIRYRKLRANAFLTATEVTEFRNGKATTDERPTDTIQVENLKFIEEYELCYSDFNIDCQVILGTGQFGIVYKGTVKELQAAIKIPTGNCGKETFKNILSEVKVLCHLGNHQHIVCFLGAYVQEIRKGKLYIATALCENGSLEKYLRNHTQFLIPDNSRYVNLNDEIAKKILPSELTRFSLEIARGMEYISSKNIVHGDLAARNILLDSKLVCKIGDFGLSRKVYEYQKYVKTSQEPLPWKWMAYESLTQMEFTSMSDVWSYGVTVWEIFSLGHMPYAGLHWSTTFANELRNGLRLPAPEFASQLIYEKLQNCWELDAKKRPNFIELGCFFQNIDDAEYQNVQ